MKRRIAFSGFLFAAIVAISAQTAAAQFTEDFGNAGTVRKFQGQVRDSRDAAVAGAGITVTSTATKATFELTADEYGVFKKSVLPAGKYEVRVRATGFNLGTYTIQIAPAGSKMYVITRLSPGCASGDSGVALLKRLKDPSIKNEDQ